MDKPNWVMAHRNYVGTVEFSEDDDVYFGRVLLMVDINDNHHVHPVRDLVAYEGKDISSLGKNFTEAVDDYIETCKELGKC